MKNWFDLSIFREMMLSNEFEEISSDLNIFINTNCHFYYDESNNIRKLWLKENDFNAPVDRDFVLGGVMHLTNHCSADVIELKKQLRLQSSAKELKFKHVSTSKQFLDCLSESKVHIFLQWLFNSDLYIHYANINNLYYAIVDVVDSIDEPSFIPFNFQLKNELYKLAVKNYDDFCKLLIKYNYPNISNDYIFDFYQELINYIENDNVSSSFELELLRQGLKNAKMQNELVFLQDNPEKTAIENYFNFYLRPIGVFSTAKHVFDNEYCIEEQFDKYQLYDKDDKLYNFTFVDSKDNLLVQVSDCVVGLLGKYYTYVNHIDMLEVGQIVNKLTPVQKSTLNLFAKIMKKSEDKSKLLISSCESLEERQVAAAVLYNALAIN